MHQAVTCDKSLILYDECRRLSAYTTEPAGHRPRVLVTGQELIVCNCYPVRTASSVLVRRLQLKRTANN